MSHAFAFFFVMRYLNVEWSVNTMVFDPSKYERNFSNANSAAKILFCSSVVLLCVI